VKLRLRCDQVAAGLRKSLSALPQLANTDASVNKGNLL